MKILSVQFKNLNSLKGQWKIDFTDPIFTSDGIFSIIGPTGSGKTTILDAICLALYGRTPRLKNITGTNNEIMSKHTGDCFSEVVFQVSDSQGSPRKYICNWSQHRARENPEGNLQSPRHEVSDYEKKEIIGSGKASETPGEIKKLIKLGFEEFTRAVMLAQGEFSAFLKAKSKDQADILEHITNTGHYKEISKRVYDRTRTANAQVDIKKQQLGDIVILNDDQIKELNHEIAVYREEIKKITKEMENNGKLIKWLTTIEELEEEHKQLVEEKEKLQNRIKDFQPQQDQLTRAEKAKEIQGIFTPTVELREEIKKKGEELEESKRKQQEHTQTLERATQSKEEAENKREQAKKNQEERAKLITQVRGLDGLIKERIGRLDKEIQDLSRMTNRIGEDKKQLGGLKEEQKNLFTQQNEAEKYLNANRADRELTGSLQAIKMAVDTLKEDLEKRETIHGELGEAQERLKEALNAQTEEQNNKKQAEEALTKAQEEVERVKAAKDKLLNGGNQDVFWENQTLWTDTKNKLQQIRLQVDQLINAKNEQAKTKRDLQKIEETLQVNRDNLENAKRAKEKAEGRLEELRREVNTSLTIINLEKQRANLQAGQPCSLCGSTVHPWADPDAVPEVSQTEESLKKAEEQVKSLGETVDELSRDCAAKEGVISQHLNALEKLTTNIDTLNNQWEAALAKPALSVPIGVTHGGEPVPCPHTRPLDFLDDQLNKVEDRLKESSRQIQELRVLNTSLERAQAQAEKARETVDQATHRDTDLQMLVSKARGDKEGTSNSLDEIKQKLERGRSELVGMLQPFGESMVLPLQNIDEVRAGKLESVLGELGERKEKWERANESLNKLKQELHKCLIQQEGLNTAIKERTAEHDEQIKLVEKYKEEVTTPQAERRNIFGDKDPNVEEERLNNALKAADDDFKQATDKLIKAQVQATELNTEIHSLENFLTEFRKKLESLEAKLLEGFKDKGFVDEEAYRSSLMSPEELNRLGEKAKSLDREGQQLDDQLQANTDKLNKEREASLTEKSLEELKTELEEQKKREQDQHQNLGTKKRRLEEDKENKEKHKQQGKELLKLKAIAQDWGSLSELIGSADGAKMQRLVYRLTLKTVLAHANNQLGSLTDRYILQDGDQKDLGIYVIDRHHGDVKRPINTLSGGETFIVSLGLALGLSRMASKNMEIDTLFLDEGFGSLDEDTLNTALDTLATLKHDGDKLIGIISHVQTLKDRISAQIEVMPTQAATGWSTIKGPGCTRV